MPAEGIVKYLKNGLAATPVVLERLASQVSPDDLDRQPDPERFTLRGSVAHLADWEGVWHERVTRMLQEDDPFLPGYDESQWAIDHHYARADFSAEVAKFVSARAKLMALLGKIKGDDWLRTGNREEIGVITIFDLAVLVLGHDGYHLRQIVDFTGTTP